MKNRHSLLLALVTCLFVGFVLGFLAGRTGSAEPVIISVPADEAAPATGALTRETATLPVLPAQTGPAGTSPVSEQTDRININTATASQLDSLPGIGPVLAQRIIDYREANGPFRSVSQLTLVEGIGEKRLAAILDLITAE